MMNISKYFDKNLGFGKDTDVAVELLKKTIEILENFDIQYCLIAGTLLGHIRHEGFIPWDDDIDLLVDSSIIEKLPFIYKKYSNSIDLYNRENFLIKTCFRDRVSQVLNQNHKQFLLSELDTYNWPFVDLFIYTVNGENINFFGKDWKSSEFFPVTRKDFMGLQVMIPNNPHYFLQINYEGDYMNILQSSNFFHRTETCTRILATMKFKDYENTIIK